MLSLGCTLKFCPKTPSIVNKRQEHKCKIGKYEIPDEFPHTIPEFPNTGNVNEFWDKHVKPGSPAIIRSFPEVQQWKSFNWKTFSEMNEFLPPKVKILVEKGTYIDHDFESKDIAFSEYLKQLDHPQENKDPGYLAQSQIFDHFPRLKEIIQHPSVNKQSTFYNIQKLNFILVHWRKRKTWRSFSDQWMDRTIRYSFSIT